MKKTPVFTYDDLKYLRSLSLFEKVQKTQSKILEWCNKWDWNVYVSFSGGKDSTVLLDLVNRVAESFGQSVPAVFCNTGLEYKEIVEFVKKQKNITIIKPEMNFRDVIQQFGYPVISKEVACAIEFARKGSQWAINKFEGRKNPYSHCTKYKYLIDAPFLISDKCCLKLKKEPFKRYQKETKRKPILGTLAEESRRRMYTYLRNGCNAFNTSNPISNPLSFWTTQDILQYIKEFNIEICPIYGEIKINSCDKNLYCTGCERTGCAFCLFGVNNEKNPNRFQKMKLSNPKLYNYCIKTLELGKVLDFIGVEYDYNNFLHFYEQ